MQNKNQSYIFLDGTFCKKSETSVSPFGQSLHYGYGVFEGIRAYKTPHGPSIFKAKEHYERLIYSAQKLHIDLPYSVDQLINLSYQLLEMNQLEDAYIRPLVYLGDELHLTPSTDVHVFIAAWSWDKYLGHNLVRVMTSPYQRPNPKSVHVEAKATGHYTNSILAGTHARKMGFDEALLLDMNGHVAEGPGANFFYQKDDTLYTCPKGHILPGITRQTILELANILDIPVVERYFTPEEVHGAQGAFFVGTAAEVAGIQSLDNVPFQLAWEDTFGYELSKAYQREVLEQEPVWIF